MDGPSGILPSRFSPRYTRRVLRAHRRLLTPRAVSTVIRQLAANRTSKAAEMDAGLRIEGIFEGRKPAELPE